MGIVAETVYRVQCGGCGRWLSEPEGPGGPLYWLRKSTGANRWPTPELAQGAADRANNTFRTKSRRGAPATCPDCR
jgi:hypothetical protein